MGNKIRNMASAFVIFYVLVILTVNFFDNFSASYEIPEENLDSGGKNVFQRLAELNLIQGLNNLSLAIQKLSKIGNAADILGALAAGAVGTLQLMGGIVTFPLEIWFVISPFYENIVPPIIAQFIGFAAVISVAFILLSAKLGSEL